MGGQKGTDRFDDAGIHPEDGRLLEFLAHWALGGQTKLPQFLQGLHVRVLLSGLWVHGGQDTSGGTA